MSTAIISVRRSFTVTSSSSSNTKRSITIPGTGPHRVTHTTALPIAASIAALSSAAAATRSIVSTPAPSIGNETTIGAAHPAGTNGATPDVTAPSAACRNVVSRAEAIDSMTHGGTNDRAGRANSGRRPVSRTVSGSYWSNNAGCSKRNNRDRGRCWNSNVRFRSDSAHHRKRCSNSVNGMCRSSRVCQERTYSSGRRSRCCNSSVRDRR